MNETPEESKKPEPNDSRTCAICGERATRIIFSSVGHWKLCAKTACYEELTDRYSDSDVTWMARALPT